MKKFLFLLLAVPLSGRAQEKLSETNYKIYSVKLGKEIPVKGIIQDMKDYDVLFFGEEYNDSVAHFLEKAVLELMQLKFSADVALSLEMFDRDVQLVMDEYLKGFMRERNFMHDARAWNNYADYKPLISFAKENSLDVICSNAAGRYAYLAGKRNEKGLEELPAESSHFIAPVPYDTATGDYLVSLTTKAGHVPAASAIDARTASAPGFCLNAALSLGDATMAYSLSQYLKKNKEKKILHVAGKYHSDGGFGIVSQLNHYNSRIRPLIISTNIGDDSYPTVDWSKYAKDGDFIIVTDPNIPRTYQE